MKHHNPHTPIMIREALGVEPRVYARYGSCGLSSRRFQPGLTDISDRTRQGKDGVVGGQDWSCCSNGRRRLTQDLGLDDKAIESKIAEFVKSGI